MERLFGFQKTLGLDAFWNGRNELSNPLGWSPRSNEVQKRGRLWDKDKVASGTRWPVGQGQVTLQVPLRLALSPLGLPWCFLVFPGLHCSPLVFSGSARFQPDPRMVRRVPSVHGLTGALTCRCRQI